MKSYFSRPVLFKRSYKGLLYPSVVAVLAASVLFSSFAFAMPPPGGGNICALFPSACKVPVAPPSVTPGITIEVVTDPTVACTDPSLAWQPVTNGNMTKLWANEDVATVITKNLCIRLTPTTTLKSCLVQGVADPADTAQTTLAFTDTSASQVDVNGKQITFSNGQAQIFRGQIGVKSNQVLAPNIAQFTYTESACQDTSGNSIPGITGQQVFQVQRKAAPIDIAVQVYKRTTTDGVQTGPDVGVSGSNESLVWTNGDGSTLGSTFSGGAYHFSIPTRVKGTISLSTTSITEGTKTFKAQCVSDRPTGASNVTFEYNSDCSGTDVDLTQMQPNTLTSLTGLKLYLVNATTGSISGQPPPPPSEAALCPGD